MFKSDTQFCSIKLLRVDEFFSVGGPAHHPVSIQADAWIRSAHQSAQSLVQSQSDQFESKLQKQKKGVDVSGLKQSVASVFNMEAGENIQIQF